MCFMYLLKFCDALICRDLEVAYSVWCKVEGFDTPKISPGPVPVWPGVNAISFIIGEEGHLYSMG